MESFDGVIGARFDTLRKVVDCMERAGIAFLDDGEPGVRLRRLPEARKDKPTVPSSVPKKNK